MWFCPYSGSLRLGYCRTALDRVDPILQKERYIAGDVLTETDIRLFVTLLSFDELYSVYLKKFTRSVSHTDRAELWSTMVGICTSCQA